jgi:peptidoglycan/xylan/chitin deacetylase (PgdA/CDA1 family)
MPVTLDRPPGALVISLDFELRWGVRDWNTAGHYTPNLHGARVAIPRILALFAEFDVAATWATVGMLFARNRAELQAVFPAVRPAYVNRALSPYGEAIGEDERTDPLSFAPSLLESIAATPRQEIATHTFSHYYCTEAGQDVRAFGADLDAACTIAAARGVTLRSIVFPRNLYNPAYNETLRAHGITTFRGNPRSWLWDFTSITDSVTITRRVARLADVYVPLDDNHTQAWTDVVQSDGLADVRASRFLAPHRPGARLLEPVRLARIRRGLDEAAARGRLFHLWWHPHNFGAHLEQNLTFLRRVLETFARNRDRHGMVSLTMDDVATRARLLANGATHDPTAVGRVLT